MKLLSGSELVGFIMERQAKQVRNLKQAHRITPKLAIIRCNPENDVISTYIRLKQTYGADIGVEVEMYNEAVDTIDARIDGLNARDDVHGVIIQLPVTPSDITDTVLERVAPHKDVDGLSSQTLYDPATPMAILWLLAGYNVTLEKVAVVGRGRLVGAPLVRMLENSGVEVAAYDKDFDGDLADELQKAKIVITATGQAGLIRADMLAPKTTVIDAGTASEDGVIRGDLADDVRRREDLVVTPERGGVGPLTVAALFDNVLRAARRQAS